jgi:predicted Fe-Mo cluster-binding NifX family protein
MKIAIVTDDGRTVSPHFGRARAFAVLTVEDGTIVSRELRDKFAPHSQPDRPPHDDDDDVAGAHGTGPVARGKHLQMLASIGDCAFLIAGGMGRGAYDHASALGIRPIVTSLRDVDAAAVECAAGRILDEAERLH